MQTAIRKPFAALLLAIPAAAALVAVQPAQAQPARVAAPVQHRVEIQRFDVVPNGPVRPGTIVEFRVRGTPGAAVTVDVPGEQRDLALAEVRPGLYEGRHTIRRFSGPNMLDRVTADLRIGRLQASARGHVDDRFAQRDQRPPQILDVTPSQNARVEDDRRVRIAARFIDDRSGVDPSSVRLRIDGRDVTRRAQVDGDRVVFRDDLPRGRHTAELVVSDRAGNAARTSWSFVVTDDDRRVGHWDDRRR